MYFQTGFLQILQDTLSIQGKHVLTADNDASICSGAFADCISDRIQKARSDPDLI